MALPGQDSRAFGDRIPRALRQLLGRGAAERMTDGHEPISVGAEHTRHELGRAREFRRHDGDRRYSQPVAGHRVMQTARRAAASIADPSDQGVPLLRLLHNVGVGGSAVV